MVTVGFVVEGPSDKKLVESESFQRWMPAATANCSSRKITAFVDKLKIQAKNPDKVIVLADLDPDRCAPCISKRKEIIGNDGIDLIVIARKALESWFLADTEAMRRWTGNKGFYEDQPETLSGIPWDRLKEIGRDRDRGRGPGASKIIFARKFIRHQGFDVRRAAEHPACPSARYFVERLRALRAG